MSTIVKILGQDEPTQVEKKKIEFVKHLNSSNLKEVRSTTKPDYWQNILLISRRYHGTLDLMYAYNGETGCLYLGHFNDGIV